MDLMDTFSALWMAAQAHGNPLAPFDVIQNLYSEDGRFFHNLAYLEKAVAEYENIFADCTHPLDVGLAVFFGKAVYVPGAQDNLDLSGRKAVEILSWAEMDQENLTRIYALIQCKALHVPHLSKDEFYMRDMELGFLGHLEFEQYEALRMQEALHGKGALSLSLVRYQEKRTEELEEVLSLKRIYVTDFFCEKYERAAVENIEKFLG